MKLLALIERHKSSWMVASAIVIFFLLRLPSLIEPYWYGDEAIYQTIGIALREGRSLYTEIWDNKPPFIYWVYAMFYGDLFWVRLTSLFFGIGALITFFLLCVHVFKNQKLSLSLTFLFAILFGLPLIEGNIANAENFMILPILIAAALVYKYTDNENTQKAYVPLWIAGIFLAVASLFKIVAVFDLIAFASFLVLMSMRNSKNLTLGDFVLKQGKLLLLLSGFLVPLFVVFAYFVIQGREVAFLQATFVQNISYVGYHNQFLIPQGLLVGKLLILFGIILFIAVKKSAFQKNTIFILLWFAFSVFNAYLSQRPYTHYVLVALPSALLFFGLLYQLSKKNVYFSLFGCLLVFFFASNFTYYNLKKTALYYGNYFQFLTGQKDITSYQAFFDGDTPRDYALAWYIGNHTETNDTILVWGNNPQIYVLSRTLPPGKYTVAYHVNNPTALKETQVAFSTQKPKIVVLLPSLEVPKIDLTSYVYKGTVENAHIYERIR